MILILLSIYFIKLIIIKYIQYIQYTLNTSIKMSAFNNNYEKLESKVIQVLSRNPDKLLTHRYVCNEISSELDTKDPVLLNKLKDEIAIVMRFLKKYDNFDVLEEDGSLKAVFMIQTVDNKSFTNIIDDTDKTVPVDINDVNKSSFSSDISVIQFIIDNNLENYYTQKDYKGNMPLHYLMIHGDTIRASKLIDIDNKQLLEENADGKTPIDLVKDLTVANFLIRGVLSKQFILEERLTDVIIKSSAINSNLNKTIFELTQLKNTLQYVFILYIIYKIFIERCLF